MQAANEREVGLVYTESTSKYEELEHKSRMLELVNQRLKDDLKALSICQVVGLDLECFVGT